MDQNKINSMMHKVEDIIEYKFNNITFLSKAMNRTAIPRPFHGKQKSYSNEYYALIGDALIKIAFVEYLCSDGCKTSGEITIRKQQIENNDIFHNISLKQKLNKYAYNDKYFALDNPPQHLRVASNKHDSYIEAIVAAIYYDNNKNLEKVFKWIENWLIPKIFKELEESKVAFELNQN